LIVPGRADFFQNFFGAGAIVIAASNTLISHASARYGKFDAILQHVAPTEPSD